MDAGVVDFGDMVVVEGRQAAQVERRLEESWVRKVSNGKGRYSN